VPNNTTFVSCDPFGKYGATLEGREYVDWFIDAIPPGGKVSLILTVKVNECTPGTAIENTALYEEGLEGLTAGSLTEPVGGKTNATSSIVERQDAGKLFMGNVSRALAKMGDSFLIVPLVLAIGASFLTILSIKRRKC